MPKKLPVIRKQVGYWFIHLVIFLIANALLWYVCYHGKVGWVYPWPSWITAAWGLWLIGHACLVWASYEDRFYQKFRQESRG